MSGGGQGQSSSSSHLQSTRDFICHAGAGATVHFTVDEQLKGLLRSHGDSSGQLTIGANMVAAGGAAVATAIMTNPLWVVTVKTRLQTQGMREDVVPYKSVLSALGRITCEEGIQGLYRSDGIISKFLENTTVDKLSPSVAIASSVFEVIASVMTYPHGVVGFRLQEQGQVRNPSSKFHYAGVIDCVKKVFQKEGTPGFYRGCPTNLLRTTPSAVITFTSYEMIHRFLQQALPPDNKHSDTHPKPDGHVKPQPEKRGSGDDNNTDLRQSIPLKKERFAAGQ